MLVHIYKRRVHAIYIFLILFFTFFLIHCAARLQTHIDDLRFITVCVLNDTKAPVSQHVINTTLSIAFQQYKDWVGIIFTIVQQVSYAGDLTAWDIDQGLYIRDQCNIGEIRIVFSNQIIARNHMSYFEGHRLISSDDKAILGASSNSFYGYILVYESDEQFTAHARSGESALVLMLRHEIAHLFGLDDNHDQTSFMYPFLPSSDGLWTHEIITMLLTRKHTAHWFPPR